MPRTRIGVETHCCRLSEGNEGVRLEIQLPETQRVRREESVTHLQDERFYPPLQCFLARSFLANLQTIYSYFSCYFGTLIES